MTVMEPIIGVRVGEREVDPVTVATIWHSLQRTCREMRHLLGRTAQSFLISQLKDISTGIWAADGTTLAVPEGLAVQFVGGKYGVGYILNEYKGEVYPGDVYLCNDPYRGYSCHLPDWGFFRPIFCGDELMFWTLCRTHMEDTGAAYPGAYFSNPYDVHAEGILIPAVKIIERGKEVRDVMKLVWNNLRLPENVRLDSYAAIAATTLCQDRMQALVARYGAPTVKVALASMVERTERATRAVIAAMPDGTYYGESSTDDDGVVLDVPVTVRVEITIKGDEITLDFSKSDPQQKGYVNAIYESTYSLAVAGVTLFLGSDLAEYANEGLMRPLTVVSPEGRVTSCTYPAPVGGSPVNVGHNTLEAIMMAMSEAVPRRAAAGWGRRYGQYTYGHHPRTGQLYVYTGYEAEGGPGAVYGYDGYPGIASVGSLGEIVRPNTEDVEIRFPWRVIRREFLVDSGQAGRWRGAPGFVWEVENLGGEAGMHTGAGQGETTFSHGASGGCPTAPNQAYIIDTDGQRRRARVHRLHHMQHGERLLKFTSGGGGVGLPWERDPQAVWEDVYLNQVVSLEGAREVYKVAINPDTREIDVEETARLRADPRQQCLPSSFPQEEAPVSPDEVPSPSGRGSG
jgi:N-methylhydantoinase B